MAEMALARVALERRGAQPEAREKHDGEHGEDQRQRGDAHPAAPGLHDVGTSLHRGSGSHRLGAPRCGAAAAPKTRIVRRSGERMDGYQTATNRSPGAILLRSPASLVTTACPALCAQTTTWASAMSAVAVRANRRPTAVASGPLSETTSVPACRISRERRACLAGLRRACARAVAGIVIRPPRSAARARSTSTRRSFRSSAISPPASNVMPFTPPSLFGSPVSAPGERAARRPTRAPSLSASRPFVAAHLPTSPAIPKRRKARLQRHASRRLKRWLPLRPRPARELLQADRPQA